MRVIATWIGAAVVAAWGCATAPTAREAAGASRPAPIVIAHRGASGVLPEHTLPAYARAIELGADFVEPDLVMTKDGILVCRHDVFLSTTTNIADRPEFADRKTTVAGREDWYVWDFTLAELKTLRARQPFDGRPDDHDDRYAVPTFEEMVDLVMDRAAAAGRVVGVYPETKQPATHAARGLDMAAAMTAALAARGWRDADAPVIVQSFEAGILQTLRERTGVRLVELYAAGEAPDAAAAIARLAATAGYADGVGPDKRLAIGPDGEPTGLIVAAHARGLFVHAWTFRDDRPPADGAAPEAEIARAFAAGVDGVFADFPDTAVTARAAFAAAGADLR